MLQYWMYCVYFTPMCIFIITLCLDCDTNRIYLDSDSEEFGLVGCASSRSISRFRRRLDSLPPEIQWRIGIRLSKWDMFRSRFVITRELVCVKAAKARGNDVHVRFYDLYNNNNNNNNQQCRKAFRKHFESIR